MNKIILTGFILFCFTEFISGKIPLRYIGPETKVRDFCISSDGLQVYAAFGNTIGIYDIETGNHIRSLGSSQETTIFSVGLSSDDSILVYGTDEGSIVIHDLNSGSLSRAEYSKKIITSIDIHSGENLIVAGTFDGEIIVTDIGGNNLWRHYLHDDAVSKVSISADGRFIVSSGLDGKIFITWLDEDRKTQMLREENNPCRYIAISSDGNDLIAASQKGGVTHWYRNPVGGFFIIQQYNFMGWVTGVDFFPDGREWTSCTSRGEVIINLRTGMKYEAKLRRTLNKVQFIKSDYEVKVIVSIYNKGLAVLSASDMKLSRK